MKVLVTGATGFLGRSVVEAFLAEGASVRAVVRPAADAGRLARREGGDLELVRLDLRAKKGLAEALRGVDVVVHLAADKFGDFHAQFAANVVATENLLEAMTDAGVHRIVAVSTFSVYDFLGAPAGSVVDEDAPLEPQPERRDDYARSKLLQEELVLDAGKRGFEVTVLRPGVIFGEGNLWNAWLGFQPSPTLWIRTGARAVLPLAYVENCAHAIAMAGLSDDAIGHILNVVDDELPTQREYVEMLARRAPSRPKVIPIAWTFMRLLAWLAQTTNELLFRGRAKVPSILVPARLHARGRPLRYSNGRIKNVLGWRPRFGLIEAVERSLAAEAAHAVVPAVAAADSGAGAAPRDPSPLESR